jgi:hypothetical protein
MRWHRRPIASALLPTRVETNHASFANRVRMDHARANLCHVKCASMTLSSRHRSGRASASCLAVVIAALLLIHPH